MKYKFTISIGDWSSDGHGISETLPFECNYAVEDLINAYKKSCKKTGLQFNHNEDYTGHKPKNWSANSDYENRLICTEYEDGVLHAFARNILKEHGIDPFIDEENDDENECMFDDGTEFAELILEFIKISLPDLKWEEAAVKKSAMNSLPSLNEGGKLNVQFGYGIFSN